MGIRVSIGDRLFGQHEVVAKLKENAVYQWVRAINRHGQPVILQVLVAPVDPDTRDQVIIYFDTLQTIRRRELLTPTEVLYDADYPLVAVYADILTQPLYFQPEQPPETPEFQNTWDWLEQAANALFALHNKQLVYGCLTPESFVLVENSVHLHNFGYAPLLERKHPETLQTLRQTAQFLAPETAQQPLTTTADGYAFAKIVVQWQPQLTQTSWYSQATALNPSDRFRRMRDLFNKLKQALFSSPSSKEILPEPTSETTSNLVPKFKVQVTIEPVEGGTVERAGDYRSGTQVTLQAIPSAGWQFNGWSGGLTSADNPTPLSIDGNKTIIAQFTRIAQVTLVAKSEPPGVGSITGSSSHPLGTTATLRASSTSNQWQFDHWSGALGGSANPAQLIMDVDKEAIAHFVLVPVTPISIPEKPPKKPSTKEVPWAQPQNSPSISNSLATDTETDKNKKVPWAQPQDSPSISNSLATDTETDKNKKVPWAKPDSPSTPDSPIPDSPQKPNRPKWAETDDS